MAIVSMAAVMTSCSNDEADFVAQKAPVANTQNEVKSATDINLVVAVSPEQMNYYDETYVVSIGSREMNIKFADMTPVTDNKKFSFGSAQELCAAFGREVRIYTYSLGKINAGQVAKLEARKLTIKADHPTEEFDFIRAACFEAAPGLWDRYESNRVFGGIHANDDEMATFAKNLGTDTDVVSARY